MAILQTGNTGIQGDYCDAIWIDQNGDPYIGGYDPIFEEGGFAKFKQSENRWINYSNVDYPVIGGHEVGDARINDIVQDNNGKLWMATWQGALKFDPAAGGSSFINYKPNNSGLLGYTTDLDIAPDNSVWFVSGGLVRFNQANNTWTYWQGGEQYIAAQPRSGGGYDVWSAASYFGYVFQFNSTTGTWTSYLPDSPGQIAGMPGKDCVDDAGNFWAFRMADTPGDWEKLDYRRPDGTWVSPAPPYPSITFDTWAFKAFGNAQALLVNGNGETWRFNGTTWSSLGIWRPGQYSQAVDIDAQGNVWVSGVGGAAKRNAQTGIWQRYRITNTGQFSNWNYDLTMDPVNNTVWIGGNAGTGIGGMMKFDGERWFCFNQATYGLGVEWPFQNDDCRALEYRESNGNLAISPLNWLIGIYEWTGTGFNTLLPAGGAQKLVEDSQGRLWALGEYFSLNYYSGGTWTAVELIGWGNSITKDPTRTGTVWASTSNEILRTDGTYNFIRTTEDFPELNSTGGFLLLLLPDQNNIAWVGSDRGLIKLNAGTGTYQFYSPDNSNIPGDWILPYVVSPDGKVWFSFSNSITNASGLGWYNGTDFGSFTPSPTGLPNDIIQEIELKILPNGYELWISCMSRGVAVLTVINPVLTLSIGFEAINSQDTISVELRNASAPFNLIESHQSIGGQGIAHQTFFSNAVNGSPYYIVVKHRNSIETWSGHVSSFSAGVLTYNFTTAANQALGNNMKQVGSLWSFYSGDVNQDDVVDLTDIVSVFNDAGNFVSGYVNTDLTGNMFVDLSDITIAYNNSSNFVHRVSP
ncbi:MAG: hypothetical protein IPL53_13780 [Ignavibacteria bacterium]|nr:hypothetical protein [Ignavibacteria bacterium]